MVAFLRERGIKLIIYLDDLLVIASSPEVLSTQISLIQLFQALGLIINESKSHLIPTQEIVFLGFQLSSAKMTISLPQEKMRKIKQEAVHLLQKPLVSIQELATFVGKTTAARQAISVAPLFHRQLQALINSSISQAQSTVEIQQAYHQEVALTEETRAELQWWAQKASAHNQTPVVTQVPDMVIETDASLMGWGAQCQEHRTGGQWSVEEKVMHINALELLAVSLALKAFVKDKSHVNILIQTDSMSAKAYINHLGGTHSHQLNLLAVQLWKWCLDRHISLTAEHLPGKENQIADEESRIVRDQCDWMIHPNLFAQIQQEMGPLEVDLFASRLTHQLPCFYSWRPDPLAEATDAFTQDWSQFRSYANPPWCLILRTLSKIQQEKARVLLIAPVWRTQPWYPLLLQLLVNILRLLPRGEEMVISPTQKNFIMPTGVPQLAAWPLSGRSVDQEAFWKKLLNYSQHPGELRHLQVMRVSSNIGIAGVRDGIEIPLGVL